MAWNPISALEIQVDDPLTDELLGKIKDDLDDLNTRISVPIDVPNGTFQTDTDSDGVPDNFTRSLYTGGSGAFDTATPYIGLQAYKFTRTLGAGNGGGYLDTTYLEISEYISPLVEVALKASVAGIRVMVQARYFDKDKAYLSSEDIYSSVANPTTWARFSLICIPVANAKYMKVRLIGGYTDTNVAGNVSFGSVRYNTAPHVLPVYFFIGPGARNYASFADIVSANVKLPKGFKYLFFIINVQSADAAGQGRARIGSVYSEITNFPFFLLDLNISTLSGEQEVWLQGAASTAQVFVSKTSYFGLCTR